MPPALCTALMIGFQAVSCASVYSPGVFGYLHSRSRAVRAVQVLDMAQAYGGAGLDTALSLYQTGSCKEEEQVGFLMSCQAHMCVYMHIQRHTHKCIYIYTHILYDAQNLGRRVPISAYQHCI